MQPAQNGPKTDPGFLLRVAAVFDAAYYYATYPDVAAAKVDAFQHYCMFGWRELRDPSADFSTLDYLEQHPQVKQAGQNPLFHFVSQQIAASEPAPEPALDAIAAPCVLALDFFPNGLRVPAALHAALTEAGQTRLAAALKAQMAGVQMVGAKTTDSHNPPHNPRGRIDMIIRATQQLYRGGHLLEAAVLSSAFLHSMPLLRLHLACCKHLDQPDYTRRMLAELSAAAEPGSQQDAILFDARMRGGVFLAGDTQRFFETAPPDPTAPQNPDFVASIKLSGHDLEWQNNVLAALKRLRDDIDGDPDWQRQFRQGCVIGKFFEYVSAIETHAAQQLSTALVETERDAALRHFWQLPIRQDPAALQAIRDIWAEGRTIVIVLPHAGCMAASEQQITRLGLPITKVAAQAQSDYSNPNNIVISAYGHDPFDFVKMVKGLKASPRLLLIYPDGEHGAQRTVSMLGRRMSLGQGAAMIAYRCQSPTFFLKTRWRDGMIGLDLTQGPSAAAYADQDSFTRALDDFYLDGLQRIVMGPPLDMVPLGGFWHHLLAKPA